MKNEDVLLHSKKIPVHFLVAASAWTSRGANFIVRIFSLPILLNYLGIEKFAVFSIIVSLEGWFLLCDFGIGSAVQNYLSEARAKNENGEKLLSASAQIAMGLLAVSLSLLFIFNSGIQRFIFKDFSIIELFENQKHLILISGCFYIFTAVGTIGYKALYAFQKGYWVHVFQGLGGILSALGAFSLPFIYQGPQRLTASILAMTIPSALFSCLVFYNLFFKQNPFQHFCWETIKRMIKRGASFWTFALFSTLGLLVDYIIMARTLTAKEISSYYVLSKIFFSLFFMYNALLLAVWPKCTELMAGNQWREVSQIIKKYILFGSILMAFATGSVLLFSQKFTSLFFKADEINFSTSTILLFGLYLLIRVVSDTYAMIFQSMSSLKAFFILVPLQVLLIITGQYFLSLKYGINGILWGLIAAFILTVLWALPYIYHKRIHERSFR
jgi:O-antigen/teichoic acid export membrane protein